MVVNPESISKTVNAALREDLGSGDVTADLLNEGRIGKATLICREPAILCGQAWFDDTFQQLDESIKRIWQAKDGNKLKPGQIVCKLSGPIRPLLSGERTAINFLQTLSGTATTVSEYVALITGTGARLLDTRKTIPGLRLAQKYAVTCGGGHNHRAGLYDACLIKENHILAAGNIARALTAAKASGLPVAVEVENLNELKQALTANADRILLDNFSTADLIQSVAISRGQAELEASGNITKQNLRAVAKTGVDYISIGALTKHIRAIDFSLRLS